MRLMFTIRLRIAIKKLHLPHDKIEYEIIGGIVISPLTLNHIHNMFEVGIGGEEMLELQSFLKLENRVEPRLFICTILEGSSSMSSGTIKKGEILEFVNDKPTRTILDLKNALESSKVDEDGFIKLKTRSQAVLVLSIREIVEEEEFLMSQYRFPQTPLMKELKTNF